MAGRKKPKKQMREGGRQYRLNILFSFFSLLTVIVSLSLSWVVLAKQDFLYDVWHDYTSIGEGIDKYGPQNRFKPGFGDTTRAERIRVFAAINQAVHRGGEGLEVIQYQSPSSNGLQILLREPEVIHLQDVANLIDTLFWLAFIALLIWFGFLAYLLLVERKLPTILESGKNLLLLLIPIFLILFIIGPETVFNTLHVWIFPDEHEWFFFYQDSLMSTLMMAPTLFAWIAAAMALLALVFYLLILQVLSMVEKAMKK